jgi:hypothetical protein
MRVRWYAVRMTVVLVAVLFSGSASAQDDNQGNQIVSQFFSLSTPGARANGMGRAFVGVADDASAAITNPAGLMFLTRPQVYVEFKSSGYDQTDQFGNGIKGLRGRLSYVAVSAPINDRIAVAFSRHEFFGGDVTIPSIAIEDHVRGASYSGSISTAVRPDFKIGATLSGASISEDVGDTSDSAFGITVGGLWQANPQVSIGVSGSGWSGAGSADTIVSPNQIKFGVGVTPNPQAKVAIDVVRVLYPSDFAEDVTELHLGGEYQLMPVGQNRIFLRAGLYTGKESEFNAAATTKTTTTGTFGAGVVVGQQFQVDLAVLTRKEFVLSAAVRF